MTTTLNDSKQEGNAPGTVGEKISLDQYLSFYLDADLFAVNIGSVREILDDKSITRIPRTPDYMRGVLNVRGHAVPVVDLRLKFGMTPTVMDVNTCVIITEVEMDGEEITIGALADSVQEVLELSPEDINPPPKLGTSIDARFIQGMSKRDDSFIILLDIKRIFSCQELIALSEAGEESKPE